MLSEARSELTLADGKAAILLGVLGVGVGAAIAGMFAGWSPTTMSGPAEGAWWLASIFLVAAVFNLGQAVWPRTGQPAHDEPITYWGHVARTSSVGDLQAKLDADGLTSRSRLLYQLHAVSGIVKRKYVKIRMAMVFSGLAAAFFIVSALLN
jgi:hypothetical protein